VKLQGTMRVNEKGHLEIGGCDTVNLARKFGTPLYVLDESAFRENCQRYYKYFTEKYGGEVLYAGKTLLTLAVCRIVEEEGLSLDVVSGGELYTAVKADFPMERVYFHGNNKSVEELKFALDAKIGRYMVDNLYELEILDKLAGERGVKADIILRVTPGIEAHTHEYIKTGQNDSKFGLIIDNGQALKGVGRALELENVNLRGLHCHIGSQIFEVESYAHTAEIMMNFAWRVKEETGYMVEELNLGGGLGIYYAEGDEPKSVEEYADVMVSAVLQKAKEYSLPAPKVLVEPGRSISGPAGTTLYTLGAVKNIPGIRTYVSVDGGMCDNPRPAIYQSRYEACIANRVKEEELETYSVAGKCCESGDMLIWDIKLPKVKPGDILAVSNTGAYTYSMSSNYNRLPRPAMVLVKDGQAEVIIKRETYSDLIRNDIIPKRLKKRKVLNIASVR